MHITLLSLILCVITYLGYRIGYIPSKRRVYAPGPPPHPLVGHTFQVPSTKIWKYFEELGLKYGKSHLILWKAKDLTNLFLGPLVRLSLAGDDILVLNHPVDAEELVSCTFLSRTMAKISLDPSSLEEDPIIIRPENN